MKHLTRIAIAVLMAGVATPSFATPILPGQTVVPNTISSFGGTFTTLGITPSMPYSYAGGLDQGFVGESVGTWTNNPFGANDLTFVYQVYVSAGDIQHVSGFDFGGFSLDVEQYVDDGTNAATNADFNFGVIEFNFLDGNALTPTDESYWLIVNTDATAYTAGTIGLIDGGGTTLTGFAPSMTTPEPPSLCLFVTGLLGIAAGLRRRIRSA